MNPTPEESGRPPIDAPPTEHRRWFRDKVADLLMAAKDMMATDDLSEFDQKNALHNKLYDELTQAYMDGNEAERKTLTFHDNEFSVPDDGEFSIEILQKVVHSQFFDLRVYWGQKLVLKLRNLSYRAFAIPDTLVKQLDALYAEDPEVEE